MDDFTVTVQAGVTTLLPNGCAITLGGKGANYEVRGMSTERGAVIEVIGYQNSGSPVDVGPGTRVWHQP